MSSPRLDHCPKGLPQEAYVGADWFAREMQTVFAKNWVCAGHIGDMEPGTMRGLNVGTAPVLLTRDAGGNYRAWHNTCRHRGSEFCPIGVEKPMGKLITCPYHAWGYAASDGRLVSTAHAQPTDDFDRATHGLHPIALHIWQGLVFLNLSATPRDLRGDVPLATLDHWPIADLRRGHRWEKLLACNWKAFWENYSECLHCPGIHPELCDMVPVYSKGIMAANEAVDWTPDQTPDRNLKPGAQSWTLTGAPCGPEFPGLTQAERNAGYQFVTIWPSVFVVAHVDYVRTVRLTPIGPEQTLLTADWLFPAATLSQPGFDAAEIAGFATIVMGQDGDASEMNQRGLRSPAYDGGRLMPEEYEILRFHDWLRQEMGP